MFQSGCRVCECVCPVTHCDRINGIIVNQDLMRKQAEDGWDTGEKRLKIPTYTTNAFYQTTHTHTDTHTLLFNVSHLCHFINKLALLFFSLFWSFFSHPRAFILFLPLSALGFPACPVIHLPLFPLCLSCSLSVQQGHWNPLQYKEPLRILTTFQKKWCKDNLSTFIQQSGSCFYLWGSL